MSAVLCRRLQRLRESCACFILLNTSNVYGIYRNSTTARNLPITWKSLVWVSNVMRYCSCFFLMKCYHIFQPRWRWSKTFMSYFVIAVAHALQAPSVNVIFRPQRRTIASAWRFFIHTSSYCIIFCCFFVFCAIFKNFTELVIAVSATSNKSLYFDYITIDFD